MEYASHFAIIMSETTSYREKKNREKYFDRHLMFRGLYKDVGNYFNVLFKKILSIKIFWFDD